MRWLWVMCLLKGKCCVKVISPQTWGATQCCGLQQVQLENLQPLVDNKKVTEARVDDIIKGVNELGPAIVMRARCPSHASWVGARACVSVPC